MDDEQTEILLAQTPLRPDQSAMAAAIERRLLAERERAAAANATSGHASFDGNHEKRQNFRRMVDPGILRPNPRHIALESLQTLQKLADNIISHPDDKKYQKFKPTNSTIKRLLVEPQGTLEYAVAMGFRPEVVDFQPYYVWNPRHLEDLRVGSAIIKEALEREMVREERAARQKAEEKAAHEAAVGKVKQAFYDDRKGRQIVDERERIARAAAEARRAAGGSLPEPQIHVEEHAQGPSSRRKKMPGSGHTLSGETAHPEDDDVVDGGATLHPEESESEEED